MRINNNAPKLKKNTVNPHVSAQVQKPKNVYWENLLKKKSYENITPFTNESHDLKTPIYEKKVL